MLDDEDIKRAESNVRKYIADTELKEANVSKFVIRALKNNSDESLRVADLLYDEEVSFLWVIVCSYYSMFYMANAMLCTLGYKVGDHNPHKITSDALIIFVRNKLKRKLIEDYDEAKSEAFQLNKLSDEIIESLELERRKRSNFQYNMTDERLKSKAQTSLERAKRFVYEIAQLM